MGCPIHSDTIYMGHSTTHSHWPLTLEVQVQPQASLYGISDGQSSTRRGSSPSTLVFPCQYHTIHSFIYQQYHINLAILTKCLLLHGNSCHNLKAHLNYHHQQLSFKSITPLAPKLNSQCYMQVSPWTGRLKHMMTYLWNPN
jgi:hypothetical protein